MTIRGDEVAEIAVDVWAALLAEVLIPAPSRPGELAVRAEVTIEGTWNGRVRLETSSILARRLTAHLHHLPEHEIDDAQVADAVGELANIIGGNVKALLPAPSHLGLPGPPGSAPADMIAEAWLTCRDEPVMVVVEELPAAQPAAA